MSDRPPDEPSRSIGARAWRWTRRLILLAIGVPITLLGLVFLVTPGPGIPVLLAGLAILAIEFSWARNRLHDVRRGAHRLVGRDPDRAGNSAENEHAR